MVIASPKSLKSETMPTTSKQTTATLRYLAPTREKPIYLASKGGVDDSHNIGMTFESHTVTIFDARLMQPAASIDQQGFELIPHNTAVQDFYALQGDYYAYEQEICERVLAATGGIEALVFDHTLRSDCFAIRDRQTTREPANFIHNDYTDASAHQRLVDIVGETEAVRRSQQRFAIINLWRTINGVVWNSPMTCCDADTIANADMVAVERRAADRTGEVEFVNWNPDHRWYYYPEMDLDEALLIKTFDSASDSVSRCIHTAFDNPLAPKNAPARESIESRLLVFY